MRTVSNLLWSVLIITALIFNACKKSDTGTPGSLSYVAPAFAKDTLINLPSQIATKASNYSTQLDTLGSTLYTLIGYADLLNIYSTGLEGLFFISPADLPGSSTTKNSNGSTSWKYTVGNESVVLTYYSSSGDTWWEYSVDSASYSKELYYIDDKGTSGTADWYNPVDFKSTSPTLAFNDVWSTSGSTTNATMTIYNSDGVTPSEQFVATSTTSKSGTLIVSGQNDNTGPLVKQWSFTWTSSGTVDYIEYNPDGTIASQGNNI